MLICTKILITAPPFYEIKYTQDNDNSCAVVSAIFVCKIREASNIISVFNWIKALLFSAARWTETEQAQRERERESVYNGLDHRSNRNMRCVNRVLIKLEPLKWICVNALLTVLPRWFAQSFKIAILDKCIYVFIYIQCVHAFINLQPKFWKCWAVFFFFFE